MRQLLAHGGAQRAGAEVPRRADGLAALKLLASEQFDLMFVDLTCRSSTA